MTDVAVFGARSPTRIHSPGEVAVHTLRSPHLDIEAGEMVMMLGPSGSGKSTLLNIMGRLERPTSGRLFFQDIGLTGLGDRGLTSNRRKHIGFVFRFYNLNVGARPAELIW